MNNKIRTKLIVSLVLIIFSINGILIANSSKVSAKKFLLTLEAKTFRKSKLQDFSPYTDYLNLIKQQLERIGINLDVKIMDWPTFLMELFPTRNFDLLLLGYGYSDLGIKDISSTLYQENSSFNNPGYHTDLDWDDDLGTGKNEWYLQQNKLIMSQNERIQNYHEWQNYMMDELLPVQPLFNNKQYVQNWDTLSGYNFSDGILQSWGKMSWDSQHEGQISSDEIVIGDKCWSDLNPLYQDDATSELITDATMDPLFWVDSDKSIQPHLATNFEMLNDTHCRIYLREGIKWQSDPDGNFTDEYFDAEDVYFTLYSWKELSNDQQDFDWIDEIKIINDYTIDLFIDGESQFYSDGENEPYAEFLEKITVNILPEHYLNQTQNIVGDPDLTHPSWLIFAENCFGTGLFHLNDFNPELETILTVNPDCWWLNTSITNDPELDWNNRFGDFTGGLTQLRVRNIQDENVAQYEFENGRVDISRSSSSKPFQDNRFSIQNILSNQITLLFYNIRPIRDYIGSDEPAPNDPSITKGLAIRKAISYAINRVEINDIVHAGERHITDYPIYESQGVWCNPNIIRYNYDLGKAREYLVKAGLCATHSNEFEFATWLFFSTLTIFIFVVFRKTKQEKEE